MSTYSIKRPVHRDIRRAIYGPIGAYTAGGGGPPGDGEISSDIVTDFPDGITNAWGVPAEIGGLDQNYDTTTVNGFAGSIGDCLGARRTGSGITYFTPGDITSGEGGAFDLWAAVTDTQGRLSNYLNRAGLGYSWAYGDEPLLRGGNAGANNMEDGYSAYFANGDGMFSGIDSDAAGTGAHWGIAGNRACYYQLIRVNAWTVGKVYYLLSQQNGGVGNGGYRIHLYNDGTNDRIDLFTRQSGSNSTHVYYGAKFPDGEFLNEWMVLQVEFDLSGGTTLEDNVKIFVNGTECTLFEYSTPAGVYGDDTTSRAAFGVRGDNWSGSFYHNCNVGTGLWFNGMSAFHTAGQRASIVNSIEAMHNVTLGTLSQTASYDADAQDYFTRFETAGGSFDQTGINAGYTQSYIKGAIDDFVTGMKADGDWANIEDIALFCGGTFAGTMEKLKHSGTSACTNVGSIVAGDYTAVGGLVADLGLNLATTAKEVEVNNDMVGSEAAMAMDAQGPMTTNDEICGITDFYLATSGGGKTVRSYDSLVTGLNSASSVGGFWHYSSRSGNQRLGHNGVNDASNTVAGTLTITAGTATMWGATGRPSGMDLTGCIGLFGNTYLDDAAWLRIFNRLSTLKTALTAF